MRGGVEWKEKLLLLILWIIKGEIEVIAKKSKWLKKKPANLKSRKYVVLEIKEVILYGELIQILKLNENKLLLFGGAVETTRGVYSTTNDSYIICKESL